MAFTRVLDPQRRESARNNYLLVIRRRVFVQCSLVKIARRCTDLTSSFIGIPICSVLALVARSRKGERRLSNFRLSPASASASWIPQKSTNCLVLGL